MRSALREVARITAEMEKVRAEVGFKGNLQQFFDHLRTDPKYKTKTREALTQRYYAIGRAVDAQVPRFFSTVPKSKLEIRPYEPFREKFEAGGIYSQERRTARGPASSISTPTTCRRGPRPGSRRSISMKARRGTISRSAWRRRMRPCRSFMRFGGNTAYVEGWALYAETLGYEMGFYDDPIQRFGTLSDEMLRAMRLVVDTGIHSKGWTREQAIKYMLRTATWARRDATAEVERYIVIPSQALAYKIGALTIQRLRKKAEAELGPKFDIRDFHAQVLMTGALPLAILEQKIDSWIAARKAA